MDAESPQLREERAGSFGSVAEEYERFRPGPAPIVVEWLLPAGAETVVDLGAGTGALTRLLVGRVPEVIAVEPDARMREVLAANVAGVSVRDGRGDDIPLADAGADAVLVSSAWHWMDSDSTAFEVARVLRPGGRLGVVWSGVDWGASALAEVRQRALAAGRAGTGSLAAMVAGGGARPERALRLPERAPFGPPEHELLHWEQELSADQLVGMLGTYSRVILLPDEQRRLIAEEARRLLGEIAGLHGAATVKLPFRGQCWRSERTGISTASG
jgi:SAM-dependent methyltransferase